MPPTVQLPCPACKRVATVPYEPWNVAPGTFQPLLACECGNLAEGRPEAFDEQHRLRACAACGSEDLYVRKAFPKAAGITVVVLAGVTTLVLALTDAVPLWAVYAPLGVAALIDALLFITTGDAVACYRCPALHRACETSRPQGPFDHEKNEEFRREKVAPPKPRAKPKV